VAGPGRCPRASAGDQGAVPRFGDPRRPPRPGRRPRIEARQPAGTALPVRLEQQTGQTGTGRSGGQRAGRPGHGLGQGVAARRGTSRRNRLSRSAPTVHEADGWALGSGPVESIGGNPTTGMGGCAGPKREHAAGSIQTWTSRPESNLTEVHRQARTWRAAAHPAAGLGKPGAVDCPSPEAIQSVFVITLVNTVEDGRLRRSGGSRGCRCSVDRGSILRTG